MRLKLLAGALLAGLVAVVPGEPRPDPGVVAAVVAAVPQAGLDLAGLHAAAVRLLADVDAGRPSVGTAAAPGPGVRSVTESVAVSGRWLTVSVVGAPGPATEACGADYSAAAVESARAVVVIVVEKRNTGFRGICPMIGVSRTATAALDGPLAGRTVLDLDGTVLVPAGTGGSPARVGG